MSEKEAVQIKEIVEVCKPPKYNVVFHNDDVTTMDFVVAILINVFFKTQQEAEILMMKVHNEGSAVVGTYEYDIAVSKKKRADKYSVQAGFPLKITITQVDN